MDMKKLAVGESDFKKIISENYYYVDKSLLIKEIIDKGDTILLIPRPRRFGKTLNLARAHPKSFRFLYHHHLQIARHMVSFIINL